jgi:predicted nucleic acid-binding Zn ribbon protein
MMPIYIFFNTETEEYKEVFQKMNDVHEYFGESGQEKNWKRVFTIPQASFDSKIDPFNTKDFVTKTGAKKGTYGDLLDKSAELSRKRAEMAGGQDPVKQKYFENYSKARRGAKHPDQMKSFESKNVKIDFGSD